jgi:nitrite reductase (NO-forming)
MMADKKRMIQQILYGVSGAIKVNGKNYNADMSGVDLSDEEVADLSNYIRNSVGNKGPAISASEVKTSRK